MKKKEISVGAVVGQTFSSYGQNAKQLIPLAALCHVLPAAFSTLAGDDLSLSLLSSLAALIAALVFVGFSVLVVAETTSSAHSSLGDKLRRVWPHLGSLLLSSIVKTLLILIGLLLLIFPGIYLALRFALSESALVHESLGPIQALRRSGELTESIKWKLLLVSLVISIIVLALLIAISLFLFLPIGLILLASGTGAILAGIVIWIATVAISSILQPLGSLWLPIIYFHLQEDSDNSHPAAKNIPDNSSQE